MNTEAMPIRGPHAWYWCLKFLRDPIGFMCQAFRRFGSISAGNVDPLRPGRQFVLALGPDFNRQVLGDPTTFYTMGQTAPGPPDSALRRLRNGLTRTNGGKHLQQRRLLMPPFMKNAVAGYFPDLVAVTARLIDQWPAGQSVDMWRHMRRLALELSARLLFGREDSAKAYALSELIQEMLQRTFSPAVWMIPVNWPGTPYRRLLQCAEQIERDLQEMIHRCRATRSNRTDLLELLVKIHDEELARVLDLNSAFHARHQDRIMDDADLVGQAATLFVASYENVANVLTWTVFLLAQHPNVMAELYEELDVALGGAPPTVNQLDHLHLLDAVIKESMRVLAPVPFLIRAVVRPVDLGGLQLRQGDRVICSPYITHHLPKLFVEPEKFRPKRWYAIQPGPYEYLPFGAGPRLCIGYSFAMTEIKVALAIILQRWRLAMVPGARIDRSVKVTMAPKHGLPMSIHQQDRRFQAVHVRGDIHELVDLRGGACREASRPYRRAG